MHSLFAMTSVTVRIFSQQLSLPSAGKKAGRRRQSPRWWLHGARLFVCVPLLDCPSLGRVSASGGAVADLVDETGLLYLRALVEVVADQR